LLWKRQHGGHQEGGPVDSVEPDDIFADKMHIGGPHAALFVVGAAHGTEIRGERVEPDVEDMRLFAGDGNAPADSGAGDAEILQAAFNEADDFVFAAFGLN